jgi:hypothetical protein
LTGRNFFKRKLKPNDELKLRRPEGRKNNDQLFDTPLYD